MKVLSQVRKSFISEVDQPSSRWLIEDRVIRDSEGDIVDLAIKLRDELELQL
jgi:hypothetical protein